MRILKICAFFIFFIIAVKTTRPFTPQEFEDFVREIKSAIFDINSFIQKNDEIANWVNHLDKKCYDECTHVIPRLQKENHQMRWVLKRYEEFIEEMKQDAYVDFLIN